LAGFHGGVDGPGQYVPQGDEGVINLRLLLSLPNRFSLALLFSSSPAPE
jgi:hypothetical protein